ncbi:MAG: alkyl hydroperoxide reductase [Fluviicola sp.]|nr:MAG: alkyl hydroperoxide reductase [Fluviicola sp.]
MKVLTLLFVSIFFSLLVTSQEDDGLLEKTVPSVSLKDVNGETVNTSELSNDGKPIIISFWATWCAPCKKELNAINDLYIDWQDETGVKLVAVSVDDERTKNRVVPYVDSKSWEYEILMDPNGDFKRAMGVNNVPHTFIIDGEGNIVYSHNNYAPGDEYELYDKILELVGEE